MTNTETRQAIELLKQLWPKEKIAKQRQETLEAAIAPYDFETVKNAIMSHARGKRGNYFPDVADLTMGLLPPEPEQSVRRGSAEEAAWMKKYIFAGHNGLGRVSKCARGHGLTREEAEDAILSGADSVSKDGGGNLASEKKALAESTVAALETDPLEEVDWT